MARFEVDSKLWIGIDCGKGGAIAAISSDGKVYATHTPVSTTRTKRARKKTPSGKCSVSSHTDYDIAGMLRCVSNILLQFHGYVPRVAIEQQQPMPRDGKGAVFSTGRGQGIWEAVLVSRKLSYTMIRPAVWKQCYLPRGADKQASIDVCCELFKSVSLPRKKDEALAEAILIADYLRRIELGIDFEPVEALVDENASRSKISRPGRAFQNAECG